MPRMYRQLVALLDDASRLVDPREVEPRVDALRQEVQAERDDVDVPRPLAVAEERPFDALRARHDAELRGRYGCAAVVVRMYGKDARVAPREVPPEPLD